MNLHNYIKIIKKRLQDAAMVVHLEELESPTFGSVASTLKCYN